MAGLSPQMRALMQFLGYRGGLGGGLGRRENEYPFGRPKWLGGAQPRAPRATSFQGAPTGGELGGGTPVAAAPASTGYSSLLGFLGRRG